jgi:hypothetical protein
MSRSVIYSDCGSLQSATKSYNYGPIDLVTNALLSRPHLVQLHTQLHCRVITFGAPLGLPMGAISWCMHVVYEYVNLIWICVGLQV